MLKWLVQEGGRLEDRNLLVLKTVHDIAQRILYWKT